jgi:signal transduction histidine kinase
VNRRLSALTTRTVFLAAAALLVLVTVAFVISGTLAIHAQTRVRNRLVDRVQPALIASGAYRAALLDQETGLRGFLLSGQHAFLVPFEQGSVAMARTRRTLAALVQNEELAALRGAFATVSRSAERWRSEYAVPAVQRRARHRTAPDAAALVRGKVRFDAIRTGLAALERALTVERTQARATLNTATERVTLVFVGLGTLLLLAVVGTAVALLRGVTAPLRRLTEQVRTVAGGAYEAPIEITGLADTRQVAADVNVMRERITAALGEAREAAQTVDEQREILAASNARLEEQHHQLERSNAELEQFAYVASHDLQEPLRKVASFSQMLQRRYAGQLDERADQYLSFSVDGARRMQVLINDLLAFSRVGRLGVASVEVDLDRTAHQTADALGAAVEESGARIEIDPLPVVHGEQALLGLVLQNLIGNAIKFRRESVPPRVHLHSRDLGDRYELTCADDGIGIEATYAERIFVIFQRLHTREAYEGTGIGLAMCRKIVEHHGGRIWLDTETPEFTPGTTIRFTLPKPVSEEPAVACSNHSS